MVIPALSMEECLDEDVQIIKSVLQIKRESPPINLEQEFIDSDFLCEKFKDSCSGNVVLKVQRKLPYVIKVLYKPAATYSHEIHISRDMGRCSLGPRVLLSGEEPFFNYMVMEFIKMPPLEGVITWLNIDWNIMARVARAVRLLHDSGANFPPTTTVYEYARDHFNLIEKYSIPVPRYYNELQASFNDLMLRLVRLEDYKPCHFDLHGHNIFLGRDDIRFIDWDCAGMGNIYLELAILSLNFRLTETQDCKLLKKYFCRPPNIREKGCFFIAKTLCFGVYSVREFIRPYFGVFPPFLPVREAPLLSHDVTPEVVPLQPRYDDLLEQVRTGVFTNYISDIEIGRILLQEYLYRLKSEKMRRTIYLLQWDSFSSKLILRNESLAKSYFRNSLSNLFLR